MGLCKHFGYCFFGDRNNERCVDKKLTRKCVEYERWEIIDKIGGVK
jgi:hypothetical protein